MPETALKRNNVRVVGNGRRAMVLAHGYGCDQNMYLSAPEETLAAMKPFLS